MLDTVNNPGDKNGKLFYKHRCYTTHFVYVISELYMMNNDVNIYYINSKPSISLSQQTEILIHVLKLQFCAIKKLLIIK